MSHQLNRFQDLDVDRALRLIMEGTAPETGIGFYAALVKGLAATLNTTGAWVTEYLEESRRLRALSFWFRGEWVKDYEYDIVGTPCEPVISEARLVHIPENVAQLFPDDPDLSAFSAVSYMGVPLKNSDDEILGHLAVLDSSPLPGDPRLLSLFRIFAARAAAEHQRLRAEAEVREREERLSRLIGSAMDAIMELDQDLNVSMVNKAAGDIFNCPERSLEGKNFKQFLTPGGVEMFSGVVRELNSPVSQRQHVWIPGGLEAVCGDGRTFPVEATVSKSISKRRKFYTLILRNVNERLEAERQISELTEQAEYLKEELKAAHNFDEIIGRSEAVLSVLRDVERVANTNTSILVLGETGTGKELFARAIHNASKRRDKPLIKVNCAALPASLIESELFGHERGAFTGATGRRRGRFHLADGGTIFLDEIGELAVDLQAKLLRVLQEGEFEPVGSSQTIKVDVRIIAATNRDLGQAVAAGQFREDLYYRLNVYPITVPPLRARRDDIPLLANAFLTRFVQKLGRAVEPLTSEAVARLKAYDWPGNVRELENVIERSVIAAEDHRPNLARALPATSEPASVVAERAPAVERVLTVGELRKLEKKNVLAALISCDGRIAGARGAAKMLGMNPSTLNSRMRALGIRKPSRPRILSN